MRYDVQNFILTLLVSIFLSPAFTSRSAFAAEEESELKYKFSMPWYTTGSWQAPAESRVNPDNSVQLIPDRIAAIDLRPNFKANWHILDFIARPQYRGTYGAARVKGEVRDEHVDSRGKWLEVYGNMTIGDLLILSYGRQNYQWGAGESLNPSNRIFHETIDSKDLLYTVQGHDLLRANITWAKNFTTILIAETDEIEDVPVFRAEETFQRKSLMKNELNWNSGADYFGVVIGNAPIDGPWLGEYFNISLTDGLAFYADVSHQRNSQAWYPVREPSTQAPNASVVQLRQAKTDGAAVRTLGLAGFRYSFEGGSDLRFEFILNTAGWTKEENELAMNAIDSTQPLQLKDIATNGKRFYQPGLEYRGQKYGLVSLRVPDLFAFKDLNIYLRYLKSLQDFSSSNYVSFEYGFGESSTLLLSALATTGKPDQELRGLVSRSVLAGYRYDF